MSDDKAPNDIWDANELMRFNDPLKAGSPYYVATEKGRGDIKFKELLRGLGVNAQSMKLVNPPQSRYIAFCGHRGCGKSTELNQLSVRLDKPELFLVVQMDATEELDVNNIQYPDVLIALAKVLIKRLEAEKIVVDKVHLSRLNDWFFERIEKNETTQTYASELKVGAKGEVGLPFIGKLFASVTNSFKINATDKDELRRVIKNSFSELAYAFNLLVRGAEEDIQKQNTKRKLLFIVDGCDRLRGDDCKRFFIEDVHQHQLIKSNFIYSCPINLLHEGYQLHQNFQTFILPMIKVEEKDGEPNPAGYQVLRDMMLKRADIGLFESGETLDRAIKYSGGNPRELIRILQTTFTHTDTDTYDAISLDKALHNLAVDYKRFLKHHDYHHLYAIDHKQEPDWESEREDFLLYNLALLEYNNFWRRSNPLITLLKEYQSLGSNKEE